MSKKIIRSPQQTAIRRAVQRIEEAIMALRTPGEMLDGDTPIDPVRASASLDRAFTELVGARRLIEPYADFAKGRSIPIEIRGGARRVLDAIHNVHGQKSRRAVVDSEALQK